MLLKNEIFYSLPLLPGQYFASIMIIVGMSVIATVVVLQYHHHDPTGGKMPKWVSLTPQTSSLTSLSNSRRYIQMNLFVNLCSSFSIILLLCHFQ